MPFCAEFRKIESMQQPALDFVIETLQKIRETTKRQPRASRAILDAALAQKVRMEGPALSVPQYTGQDTTCPSEPGKSDMLGLVNERVRNCTKCEHLACSRTQTVFGIGSADAELMFVGEAPGADEDAQGEPFVGRAGQLLTKIIRAMGFQREQVYIANILKCRPDMPAGSFGNRAPTPSEMQTCRPYLLEQIDIIQPKVLVALGAVAVEGLLGSRGTMRELRGRWNSFNGIPLMITYHPAYLLRNQSPAEKRKVWEDMLQVLEKLDKSITDKQRNYFR